MDSAIGDGSSLPQTSATRGSRGEEPRRHQGSLTFDCAESSVVVPKTLRLAEEAGGVCQRAPLDPTSRIRH
jgi:hypothetical protein